MAAVVIAKLCFISVQLKHTAFADLPDVGMRRVACVWYDGGRAAAMRRRVPVSFDMVGMSFYKCCFCIMTFAVRDDVEPTWRHSHKCLHTDTAAAN